MRLVEERKDEPIRATRAVLSIGCIPLSDEEGDILCANDWKAAMDAEIDNQQHRASQRLQGGPSPERQEYHHTWFVYH